MYPSKEPLAEVTTKLQPAAVVTKGYWVDKAGALIAVAGVRARGIAYQNFSQSEVDSNTAGTNPPALLTVIQFGPAKAILGGTVGDGKFVTVDAAGKTVEWSNPNHERLGWIEKGGASGDEREIFVLGGPMALTTSLSILSIPVNLAAIAAAGDVLTGYTPGFAGKILSHAFAVSVPVTTGSKAADLNLEIGSTNVTGGVISLTSANCTPLGAVVAGTAITAANAFTATDTISVEAANVTAFVEGEGYLLLLVERTIALA
jgi:hypothetical protein